MKRVYLIMLALLAASACNKTRQSTETAAPSSSLATNPASYTPRIGIGVSTSARTCIAIQNGNLANGSVITLISPIVPVTFTQATVSSVSQDACPITQNVDTTVSNYNVTTQNPVPKLTPMIAVVGTPAVSVNTNNIAQADLDQNGHSEMFRACSADNGVHLTAWSGTPLETTMLWHGYYYESGNPGIGPPCVPQEMPAR